MSNDQQTTPEDLQAEQAAQLKQERRNAIIQPLIESVTQREKFLLADRLSRPYSELMDDPDRVLIALAWVKQKRDNKGIAPDFEQLLDMTDADVLAVLGLDNLDDDQVAEGKDG